MNAFLDKVRRENSAIVPEAPSVEIEASANKSLSVGVELGQQKSLHVFKKPTRRKVSAMEAAVEALSRAVILAMSEVNISTISPDIFGPIVSLTGTELAGFTVYNPEYLDSYFFVLKHSNRIGTVHKIIDDAYHSTDKTTLAIQYIQKTTLTLNVIGNQKDMEVEYLIFSEDEIHQISLPYVKEIRVETDGHVYFLMIDVER